MNTRKKIKIRKRLLWGFSLVLFFSFALTGVIFNLAIRLFAVRGEVNLYAYRYAETSGLIGRVGLISIVLMGMMFLVATIVTYFLANSITRPIEKLGKFARQLGHGDFTPNDYAFAEEELEDLNTALNKSARQLGVYDSEQKAFFQNASHELRTPLMSIKCYAEGISFGIMEPKQASETILQETDNLADLVTDLLTIAKLDNITTTYTTSKTDLAQLIEEAAARQQAVATQRELRFVFELDEIHYTCISELIARALDNLISNAVRYAKSEITLSCKQRGNAIEIRVADDGDGIEAQALPHVFERFFKGAGGNHGIGLSIVKSIVEQHSGHVTAENSSNGGAIFTMTLPL
ncbi:MAG: HAMP domain-containing histidine kinase [Oscillospiraceae bacterium]|nr:HAMP domain-containing histidine kinase [Oscillospiraceae bacterium]